MKAWMVLCIAMAWVPAWAINKCIGPDGKVTFQDAPCRDKGEAITVKPAAGDGTPVMRSGVGTTSSDKPMTEAQRLDQMAEESRQDRRRRQLQTLQIPAARNSLANHRAQCKATQENLKARQYQYVQNLYGKTHAAQMASEMAAAAAACDTRDRELKEQLDALVSECAALGCK